MTDPLVQPLTLPCGVTLSNRLCKAAMSEGMADVNNDATPRLEALYRRWAVSGAGLLFSVCDSVIRATYPAETRACRPDGMCDRPRLGGRTGRNIHPFGMKGG